MDPDEIDRLLREVEEQEEHPRPEDELPEMRAKYELERCGPPAFILRSSFLKGFRFEGRPADHEPPPRFSVTFLYRREGDLFNRAGVGAYADGKWTNGRGKVLDPVGLYWVAMLDER